jgi:hypothetical protein
VFPVRYELNLYMLFKWLKWTCIFSYVHWINLALVLVNTEMNLQFVKR